MPGDSPYVRGLLQDLGCDRPGPIARSTDPALLWARCGAMSLTGRADGPAQMLPVPLAAIAEELCAQLALLSPGTPLSALSGARLLTERAALAGFTRAGPRSTGGSCRLLPTLSGELAVNLARTSDWDLLPAWLEMDVPREWDAVAHALAGRAPEELLQRAHLLGLPVAPLHAQPAGHRRWLEEVACCGTPREPGRAAPRVVDLSSLWAGPLCSHLLQLGGARVIKVEGLGRPDGMRAAAYPFFDLLNAGKQSVALDFTTTAGRDTLRRLLGCADIVIEGSRPRALRQLGIDAEALLAEHPGMTWVSVTGYARASAECDWVAFGDDGAVAGGLSQVLWESTGEPLFCADAVADPLTGLHAALVAVVTHRAGGGWLRAVSLRDVCAHAVRSGRTAAGEGLREQALRWSAQIAPSDVSAPLARTVTARARPLGADTHAVLAELN
ncbi:MAG: CoA transferase [Proteobacteria bacterium]|nr:CoA transferase [Pseudomonadota bacterium]